MSGQAHQRPGFWRCFRAWAVALLALALLTAGTSGSETVGVIRIRVATYNASLNRATAGQLITDLQTGGNSQARRVAEILQRVRPDVVLRHGGVLPLSPRTRRCAQLPVVSLARHARGAVAGVFWPRTDQPGYSLISASDHRLVWLDLELPDPDGLTLGIR